MFFGLTGMAAVTAGQPEWVSLVLAAAAGGAAMFLVHWLMSLIAKLRHQGNIRIERSVGRACTVYVPIPGGKAGAGKVQVRTPHRIMEYAAMTTSPDKLRTGARVKVVEVMSPTTLLVEPMDVSPQNGHA
jgi:membrane protein implicated in regulation of membrane protease activity